MGKSTGKSIKTKKSISASSKTVYVFGAGFSYDGGVPLQADILKRIREYDLNIMSGENVDIFSRISEKVLPAKKTLEKFLDSVFASNKTPFLEDVFTLLDQTIACKAHCHGNSWLELVEIRDALKRWILLVFHDSVEKFKKTKGTLYKSFAAHLIEERLKVGKEGDSFSVISLNWDSLVEDSIAWCLNEVDGYSKAGIDFCCYTEPLSKDTPHIPSILQKAKGLYNIKILKLHGSTNWLICPNCNKIYTGIGSKEDVWSLYVLERSCEHCLRLTPYDDIEAPKLEPFLITPTFVKVFDNLHIQMIWHNAYAELASATKIVFVGYSMPDADYHLRTLFRRAIGRNIPVEVILISGDNPTKTTPAKLRQYFAKTRYSDFFAAHKIGFYFSGTKQFLNRLIKTKKLQNRLRRIKRKIKRNS